MKSTIISENWGAIRLVIYGVMVAAAGGSWLAGWITSEQADAWTNNIENLLYAAGFILAGKYVDRTPKPNVVDNVLDAIETVRQRAAGVEPPEPNRPLTVDEIRRRIGG